MLDMHSLTDMVDHIQLILKTLQVFNYEVVQLKQHIHPMDSDQLELLSSVRLLEDKLAEVTTRSDKALKLVKVSFQC